MPELTQKEAKAIGNQLGINWDNISFKEFTLGINIEFEHGSRFPEANVTNDDPIMTGKIAWAHLLEIPDYYTRLEKMEVEAEKYWQDKN